MKDQLTKYFGEFFAWTGFVALLFGAIPFTLFSVGGSLEELQEDGYINTTAYACEYADSKTSFAIDLGVGRWWNQDPIFGENHIPELVKFDLESCRFAGGVAWEVFIIPPGGDWETLWFYGSFWSERVELFARERVGYYNSWAESEWLRYLDIPKVDLFPRTGCTWTRCKLGHIVDEPWSFSMYLLSVTWLPMLAINYVFSRRFRVLPWRK